jgi:hypothetical protein
MSPCTDSRVYFKVLDVNGDGKADLYIVQLNETASRTNYCSYLSNTTDFYNTSFRAPDDYTPPLDEARDQLLIANNAGAFDNHTMDFAEPGCGWLAERFGGGKTMILAQGSQVRSPWRTTTIAPVTSNLE